MKTITYTFADGTTDTVEVTDELNAVHEELQKANKMSERRETRRHVSLEKIRTHGWDVADPKVDVFADVAKKEKYSYLYAAIATLTPAQQLLLKKIFWEGKKHKEVAEEQGVKKAAIHNRLVRILDKLKNILGKSVYFRDFRGLYVEGESDNSAITEQEEV